MLLYLDTICFYVEYLDFFWEALSFHRQIAFSEDILDIFGRLQNNTFRLGGSKYLLYEAVAVVTDWHGKL